MNTLAKSCSTSNTKEHTIPFGPNVVLTKSAIAIAPTKDACKEMELQDSIYKKTVEQNGQELKMILFSTLRNRVKGI